MQPWFLWEHYVKKKLVQLEGSDCYVLLGKITKLKPSRLRGKMLINTAIVWLKRLPFADLTQYGKWK